MDFTNLPMGGMLTGDAIEKAVADGTIIIDPFDPSCINPNSYNLKLHPTLKVYKHETKIARIGVREDGFDDGDSACYSIPSPLRMDQENPTVDITIPDEGYVLLPNRLYIGRTVERTGTDHFIPMINGRSSGGRLGISIHICAGFGDIGFDGTWTLEITVVEPVLILPYTEIAQVCFFTPAGEIKNLYRGRYYNQEEATASRFHLPKKG